MVKSFFIILSATSLLAAADLVVSKDSLKVYNNPVSSIADGVQIVNAAFATIHLDSAVISIDEMDTAGSGEYGLDGRFSVRWRERMSPAVYLHWKLEKEIGGRYRLERWSERDAGTTPLDFSGTGETLSVAFMEIGTCLGCSGIPTWYPLYFKGTLFLYFSNAQMLGIRLRSEDRRTYHASDEPCGDYQCDTLVVRRILDMNGMPDVPVRSFSTEVDGRIASLQLTYYPDVAVSLPKQLTVLPPEIGKLTVLRELDVRGNRLDSLPGQIGRCANLRTFFAANNRLLVLTDSIVRCTQLEFLLLDGNRLEMLPEELYRLCGLRSLSVTNNRLVSLPATIEKLDSIRCLFIAGNRLCMLPDPLVAWVKSIPTNTNCTRPEPVWPDSQECASVTTLTRQRVEISSSPIIRVHTAKKVLSVNIEMAQSRITRVALVDIAGRTALRIHSSGSLEVMLPVGGLACGVYTVVLYSGIKMVSAQQVLIDR